jgi:hypothetical protein
MVDNAVQQTGVAVLGYLKNVCTQLKRNIFKKLKLRNKAKIINVEMDIQPN